MAALGWLLNLGFAAGDTEPPVVASTARGGGWLPEYVRKPEKLKKRDSIREEIESLLSDAKQLPPEKKPAIVAQINSVEKRYESSQEINESVQRVRRVNLLTAEIVNIRKEISRLIPEIEKKKKRRLQEEKLMTDIVMQWYH